jgi:hypothetical protein
MLSVARKLNVAPKAKKTTEAIPRCAAHVDYESLGHTSLASLIIYVDALSRRTGKPLTRVRLPKEKCPAGNRGVTAVRCRRCRTRTGYACRWCDGWQWGFLFHVPVARQEHKCPPTEAKPATPATVMTSLPTASPEPGHTFAPAPVGASSADP